MAEQSSPERVCVGVVVGAHGIQGGIRVKSFTADPADLDAYGPLHDEAGGRVFSLAVVGHGRGAVLCRVEGVTDRNGAEALRGTRLYLDRAALPALEEEDAYYHADLIGLAVVQEDGAPLGQVEAVHDFGAGDVLEIRPVQGGATVMLPFTRAAVPMVDLAGRRLVAAAVPGLFDADSTAAAPAAKREGKPRKGRPAGAESAVPVAEKPAQEWPEEDWR